ncbi:MAG: acyl-CoA dehydrogenase C-terminal domain-containing protein [Gammaproteobacteria bacterium]|nr:acyl-CoA dehydrogenase C-terminal domain-containing protein [Gammaproteobacteria bacterium]
MLEYQAPERDLEFLLFDLFEVQKAWQDIPAFADFTDDLIRAVISEGGKLAREVMTPISQQADAEGSRWEDGVVTAPSGFREAYDQLAGGGWLGLSGNPEYGGQGMPKLLGCLLEEMFWGSNTNLYLYATLTVGASICIDAHGTEEQKSLYLPMLYSGQWSGAMDLTEPQAGTDLGIIRTKAEQAADGTYRISGTKIFITAGEHDLTENIVHLVLAKLPGAPDGTRGISLFIVPKYLPNADGSPGERNGVASGSIEEKMGVKGSATNVMNYDGAVGYLVGEENSGLACMFTMMNYERLSVGLQGLGAGELAYQQAVRYARDRLQGRAPGGPQNPDGTADSLLVHPDVRRMLLTIRAYTEAGRAFAMLVGLTLDRGKYADDRDSQALSELLTPIAKAYLSDKGFESAVLAQQVFGGHGYIKETGVEQIVRDTRIAQIYEGTNGVQALDLVGRKVLRDGGRVLKRFVEYMSGETVPDRYRDALSAEFDRLGKVTESVLARSGDDVDLPGAVSTDYLELAGLTIYAWLWARMVEVAGDDAFGQAKQQTADFFFARLLPKTLALEQSIYADSSAVMAMNDTTF